jgi:hypothetical protein
MRGGSVGVGILLPPECYLNTSSGCSLNYELGVSLLGTVVWQSFLRRWRTPDHIELTRGSLLRHFVYQRKNR